MFSRLSRSNIQRANASASEHVSRILSLNRSCLRRNRRHRSLRRLNWRDYRGRIRLILRNWRNRRNTGIRIGNRRNLRIGIHWLTRHILPRSWNSDRHNLSDRWIDRRRFRLVGQRRQARIRRLDVGSWIIGIRNLRASRS